MNNAVDFLLDLIRYKSITPYDSNCQSKITEFLSSLDFQIEKTQVGNVSNLLAVRKNLKPVFAFIGHTDVVSPGSLDEWKTNPFEPVINNNHIYGRGAADMKGNLSAFMFAVKRFLNKYPKHKGSISILLTSGEEGDECYNGIPKIMENLPYDEIEYCLVGEPTSHTKLGDTIKVGRRGSLSGYICIKGVGGHVAYPKQCSNPIQYIPNIIKNIQEINWHDSDNVFDNTSLQFTNIDVPDAANNIVPTEIHLSFNLRFSPNTSIDKIQQSILNILKQEVKNFSIEWKLFGEPYISKSNKLALQTREIIQNLKKISPTLSTSGGTSDGRYIANICNNILELGCLNSTIHKPNEKISISDLEDLQEIYYRILENTLS